MAIELTPEDWVEIEAALSNKYDRINLHGDQEDLTLEERKEWCEHLAAIMKTIGTDGRIAARDGIERCDMRGPAKVFKYRTF
jgi:hypothetical protein